MKKFSVLIAHYNNFEYFKVCYKSLLEQTYSNFEIIIVDDYSSDDSFEKIRNLVQNEVRVKLIQNEQNKGVGYTKRKCIEISTGEICGFVDPDDALVKNAIEVSLKNHSENNVVAYSSFTLCDNQLKSQKTFAHSRAIRNSDKKFFNIFLEVNHFFTFKKAAYNKTSGINPTLTSAVDQDLYLKLYETGNFTFINQPLYLYRLHSKGVSQDSTKKNKLNKNWHSVILDTIHRRGITTLYGKDIYEIKNLPSFLKVKQNNFIAKFLRKVLPIFQK